MFSNVGKIWLLFLQIFVSLLSFMDSMYTYIRSLEVVAQFIDVLFIFVVLFFYSLCFILGCFYAFLRVKWAQAQWALIELCEACVRHT